MPHPQMSPLAVRSALRWFQRWVQHVARSEILLAVRLILDRYAPAIAQTWAHLSNTLCYQPTLGTIVNKLGTPTVAELAGDSLTSAVVVSQISIKTGFDRPGAKDPRVGPVTGKYQGADSNFCPGW